MTPSRAECDTNLIIVGASARAAAFSALRAGIQPVCFDLFADRDLFRRCVAQRLPACLYPHGLVNAIRRLPPDIPLLYTGALENHPDLIASLARERPLWGNRPDVLRKVRSPWYWTQLLRNAGLPAPRIARQYPSEGQRWLIKPRRSGGGARIRFADNHAHPTRDEFLQEYIEGDSHSAVFVASQDEVHLIGITAQLIHQDWLGAGPFQYCGSIGPVLLTDQTTEMLKRIGHALARGCGLRGLFGIDFILRENTPWPVEINPRYTASVEVLEAALGVRAIALHRNCFTRANDAVSSNALANVFGKAILFARDSLTFPNDGPWDEKYDGDFAPVYLDVPHPGESIASRRPILTLFAQGETFLDCFHRLQKLAARTEAFLVEAKQSN
ncbi:MAG: hypothetical protein KatS3mg105_2351 [Gemmatales bacterium]|nr:MAG: hypothetical protein KatS3mg105_2351 [Gemmatales bacterium]